MVRLTECYVVACLLFVYTFFVVNCLDGDARDGGVMLGELSDQLEQPQQALFDPQTLQDVMVPAESRRLLPFTVKRNNDDGNKNQSAGRVKQGGWYLGKRTKNPWYLGKRSSPSKPGIWYLG